MHLKINHKGKIKKVLIKENYRSYDGLLSMLESKVDMEKKYINVIYKDKDGDLVYIEDEEDMDFFMNENKNEKFWEITVEKKKLNEMKGLSRGTRNNQNFSREPSRKSKKNSNIFKTDSPLNESDWSYSIISPAKIMIGEGLDETDFKSLLMSQLSHKKSISKENNQAISALENLYSQIMSQIVEMNLTYTSRISDLDKFTKETGKEMIEINSKIDDVVKQNKSLKTRIEEIKQVVNKNMRGNFKRKPEMYTSVNPNKTRGGEEFMKMIDSAVKKQKVVNGSLIHDCDVCGMSPITTNRYICIKCKSFNACENCKKRNKHEHPLYMVIQSQKRQPTLNKLKSDETETKLNKAVKDFVKSETVDFDKERSKNGLDKDITELLNKNIKDLKTDRTIDIKRGSLKTDNRAFKNMKSFLTSHIESNRNKKSDPKKPLDITFGQTFGEKKDCVKVDIINEISFEKLN